MARDLALAPGCGRRDPHGICAGARERTGQDEEARAILTPYAPARSSCLPRCARLGMLDLQSGDLKAAKARFEDLLSTGSQSYDALYYLGVIAERRDDQERAMRFYSRVTGGDQAIAAQQRVACFKAEKDGRGCGARASRRNSVAPSRRWGRRS